MNHKSNYKRALLLSAATSLAVMAAGVALADDATTPAPATKPASKKEDKTQEIIVVGQRKALKTAQDIKKNAEQIVDSITATDIGALPDRSVTEALQRVAGVTIGRTDSPRDVDRLNVEGSGVQIRGLSWVRSELNGQDSFGAKNGRSLSWEDLTPELLAGVDVYKNPSADLVEGGLGGTVNLRTWMPFDNKGQKIAFSADLTEGDLRGKNTLSGSFLYSNRYQTGAGEVGILVDVAHSLLKNRVDELEIDPYDAHNTSCQATNVSATTPYAAPGSPGYAAYSACLANSPWKTSNPVAGFANAMVPSGVEFRQEDHDKTRDGIYIALQYRPNQSLDLYTTFFRSQSVQIAESYFLQTSACCSATTNGSFVNTPEPGTTWNIASNGNFVSGNIWDGNNQGFLFNIGTNWSRQWTQTNDLSTGFKWTEGKWSLRGALQYVQAAEKTIDNTTYNAVIAPDLNLNVNGSLPSINIDSGGAMENPSNYFWYAEMDHRDFNEARELTGTLDAAYSFDDEWLRSFRFGVRATSRYSTQRDGGYNWALLSATWSAPTPALVSEFSSNQHLVTFNNFMHGAASAPSSLWLPTFGIAQSTTNAYKFFSGNNANPGYVAAAGTLNAQNGTSSIYGTSYTWASGFWQPFNGNYNNGFSPTAGGGVNEQSEKTDAAYALLRFGHDGIFGFDKPIDGNIGLRVVGTDEQAEGYVAYPDLQANETQALNSLSEIPASELTFANGAKETINPKHDYVSVLPSLNLRIKLDPKLSLRFAAAKSIVRPDWYQMQPTLAIGSGVTNYYTTTAQTATVNGMTTVVPAGTQEPGAIGYTFYAGNPNLKPMRSNQYDVSLEYYFNPWSLVSADVFYKDLYNYIQNAPELVSFTNGGLTRQADGTIPENFGHGRIDGVEFQEKTFFDFLPGAWSGIGTDFNVTMLESKGQRNASGSPYDAQQIAGALSGQPLEQLSRYNVNFTLMYSKYGIDGRLAYNWRSRYLMTASASNLIAPVYSESYGQLDGSVLYSVNSNIKIGIQAVNLSNSKIIEDIDERDNTFYGTGGNYSSSLIYRHNWAVTDRRFSLVLRGTF